MFDMGFKDETVEKALLYFNITSTEELIDALIPSRDGFMRHWFISNEMANIIHQWVNYCHICDPLNSNQTQDSISRELLVHKESNK